MTIYNVYLAEPFVGDLYQQSFSTYEKACLWIAKQDIEKDYFALPHELDHD